MQEITTTGIDPSAKTEGGASTSTSTSTTASFRHSGPRHAAPPRGAGHFSFPNRDVQCGKSGMTAKQAALSTFGCSKFETLHLCWDPVPGTEDSEESDRSGSEQSSTSSSGVGGDSGWPVERQDIWTNTSSQNNEAQAPPPHTAQARASAWSSAAKSALEPFGTATDSRRSWVIPSSIESKQSKVIRADLIDSIRTTIGWTRQDQQLLSDTPWLRRGSDLAERMGGEERLSRLESIVSEIAYQHTSAESSTSPGSDEKLTIRMVPATERLKLGGMYVPYTEKQRLQWFLDNLDTDDA
ncbi:hypothetical protein [Sporisorium scitamineum]|nr:hypothetical protein [Sporisorium scitamineum]